MKKTAAERVGRLLNKTDRWHSHSCGISISVLRKELKLVIEDFEKDYDLKNGIDNYYKLVVDYSQKRSHDVVLHAYNKYFGVTLK